MDHKPLKKSTVHFVVNERRLKFVVFHDPDLNVDKYAADWVYSVNYNQFTNDALCEYMRRESGILDIFTRKEGKTLNLQKYE